ncbi:hypothetical protein BN1051_00020 [Arthrobacter saudimassiliensis]|uniref:DUF2516 family protein n=1 Tax=Arthrobacter saudimassiliensis TaxID=1461584 RepID=A0A078MJX3_9MICC|nr:hypothetical protein BN1051_00020 [Arthrobacter saudimassiliensis]
MELVLIFQGLLYRALAFVALGIELWAFIDCVRRRPSDFERAFKRTKTFWTALTAGAAAVGVLGALSGGVGLLLFQLAAVIAACVYLADVRPALNEPRRGSGPYGPW